MLRRLLVPYSVIAGVLAPNLVFAEGRRCLRYECNYDAASVIIEAGSNLPRRVEPYTAMFGERLMFYPLNKSSYFFDAGHGVGGVARLHAPLNTDDGIRFDQLEFWVTNPPYVSALYFHVSSGKDAKCLPSRVIMNRLNSSGSDTDPEEFVYSPATKGMVKIATFIKGGQTCVASIALKYKPFNLDK